MEKLNELVALAEKADAVANLIDGVNPHTILAIAEAFRALLQRAEAAEAKLAELAQQKPIGWLNDAYLGRGVIDGEVGQDDFGPGYIPIYSHPFNDAPAPAADLVPEGWILVPVEPTDDMVAAGTSVDGGVYCIWKDMLTAAPSSCATLRKQDD